jgi:rSAM/selenodomain-associated transferase 1
VRIVGRRGYCAIAIMAKAPREGEVKTRLVPPLSEADAAALGSCFIRDVAGNIIAAGKAAPIEGYVAYSPPGSRDLFAPLLPEGIGLLPPRRIGLGDALFDAAEDLLAAGYGSACLVNADSPSLPTSALVAAACALAAPGDRLVLGPAEDGGYYLIGLKQPHRRLFEEIAWSSERVYRQTLDRAAEIGLNTVTLPRWYDVDDVASLRRLVGELGSADPAGYAAPHTAALLRRLAPRL